MVESGRRRGIGRINIEFTGLTRVVESASERAHRTKVEAGGYSRTTSLASRCRLWFHGPKFLVEKMFAENYNSSSSPALAHGFVVLGIFNPCDVQNVVVARNFYFRQTQLRLTPLLIFDPHSRMYFPKPVKPQAARLP